ncbi:protein of unknown function [Streptomyces sp. KY75]|nr:protein of unknown function [Streptomyces sp. KY75]CAD5978475.1 protein of unknown function [Streptomyces sp. KY70]
MSVVEDRLARHQFDTGATGKTAPRDVTGNRPYGDVTGIGGWAGWPQGTAWRRTTGSAASICAPAARS